MADHVQELLLAQGLFAGVAQIGARVMQATNRVLADRMVMQEAFADGLRLIKRALVMLHEPDPSIRRQLKREGDLELLTLFQCLREEAAHPNEWGRVQEILAAILAWNLVPEEDIRTAKEFFYQLTELALGKLQMMNR